MSALKWGLAFAGGTVGVFLLFWLLAQGLGGWATFFLAVFAFFAFVVGVSVFAATWLFRRGAEALRGLMDVPTQERFRTSEELQADMAQPQPDDELTQAAERVRRIKKAAHGLAHRALAASLERLALVAERLLTQAGNSRSAKRRLRTHLVHHLAHVEAVTLNLFRMQESGTADPALAQRAAATFDRLAQDFESHRKTAVEGKSVETEARLDLLAQELGMDVRTGAPPPPPHQPPPAGGRQRASLTPALDRLFNRPQG